MALDQNRLKNTLASDINTELLAVFPINTNLLSTEKTNAATAMQKLANALAAAVGPDVVSEITTNALAHLTGVQAGASTITGTVS